MRTNDLHPRRHQIRCRDSRTARITPPPKANEWYIAHVGVNPSARGKGIGSLLVRDHIDQAKVRGLSTVALDVALNNPAAQRLYERLGFAVTDERASTLTNDHGTMPGHRRMAFHI